MTASQIKLVSPKSRRKTTVNDKTIILFDLIRHELLTLPRPTFNQQAKEKYSASKQTYSAVKTSLNRTQGIDQTDASPCDICDLLITRLDAYENAIVKIEQLIHVALTQFSEVNVGGRKPNEMVKKIGTKIASEFLQNNGNLPTATHLLEEVRKHFFQENPHWFIKIVSDHSKIGPEIARQNSFDPNWNYWKHVEGLTSERAMSDLLRNIRITNENIFSQK